MRRSRLCSTKSPRQPHPSPARRHTARGLGRAERRGLQMKRKTGRPRIEDRAKTIEARAAHPSHRPDDAAMQFNARTTPQTVEALYAIADRQGWLVGETLERALAALQRELAGQGA